jgi:hypothetical protein
MELWMWVNMYTLTDIHDFAALIYFKDFFSSKGSPIDRLCGLVARGPGSIPEATRFCEK